MEKRNIAIDLETARKWFEGKDQSLKELALQAYSERELTAIDYDYIAKKLFIGKDIYIIHPDCSINAYRSNTDYNDANNSTSYKQCKKLLAINKLLNVAKYLNKGSIKDDSDDKKYTIVYDIYNNKLFVDWWRNYNSSIVSFKTIELAEQAIKILGEETIKLALSTDY